MLVETQRLATVGELASRMAHEFNNVLQIITGWTDNALRTDDLAVKDKALQKTLERGRRAADIVTSILGYANGRGSAAETLPAETLMEAAAGLVAWDLQKDRIQIVRRSESQALVRVVPARMEQALLNLILNARQAMGKCGGTLTLGVALADKRSRVALSVQDTGCGIPPENLPKIFEPFFTTQTEAGGNGRGGTGLGLAVVRELVAQAGGEVTVTSTVGVGSTFTILLPIADLAN
jgi:signal transduction histidine kinase